MKSDKMIYRLPIQSSVPAVTKVAFAMKLLKFLMSNVLMHDSFAQYCSGSKFSLIQTCGGGKQ